MTGMTEIIGRFGRAEFFYEFKKYISSPSAKHRVKFRFISMTHPASLFYYKPGPDAESSQPDFAKTSHPHIFSTPMIVKTRMLHTHIPENKSNDPKFELYITVDLRTMFDRIIDYFNNRWDEELKYNRLGYTNNVIALYSITANRYSDRPIDGGILFLRFTNCASKYEVLSDN